MIELSTIDQTKWQALKNLRAQGESVFYLGFVAFYWPEPIGTKYYAAGPYDDPYLFPPEIFGQMPFSPIENRLILRSGGTSGNAEECFPAFSIGGDQTQAKDTTIQIELSNLDGVIEDAYWTVSQGKGSDPTPKGGAGVPVEIFIWMPQQSLLKSLWFGYTNPVQSITGPTIKFKASWGFRTSQQDLPNAPFYPFCFNDFPEEYPELFNNPDGTPNHAARAANRCPYDPSIGVGVTVPGVSKCNRLNATGGCPTFFPNNLKNLPYTGIDSIQVNNGLPFRQDSKTLDQSIGNDSALSEPVRVIGGTRLTKQCDIVQITIQTNPDHPERGSVTLVCIVCEGPIQSLSQPSINDIPVDISNSIFRLGTVMQSSTAFIPAIPTANFSSRAVLVVVQKGNFAGQVAANFNVKVMVSGLSNLRIYSDPVTFSNGWSNNPAWFALESYRDRMWGQGVDLKRLVIQDWINLASYYTDSVSSFNPDTTQTTVQRSTWNGEWHGRKVQDQLRDFFMFRFTSMPFMFEGQMRIIPITKDDLANILVFTDREDAPWQNILPGPDGKVSSCDCGENLIDEQPNEIEGRFDDASLDGYAERPLIVKDLPAQKKAGENAGDNTIKRVKKPYFLTGVTSYAEALRIINRLLDVGEFDNGGLVNPIWVTFDTTLLDALTLHPYRIIQIDSYKLDRMVKVWGFKYFRVMNLEYKGLRVTVTCQAYPDAYYAVHEDNTQPLPRRLSPPITGPGSGGSGGPGTGPGAGGPGNIPKDPKIKNPLLGDDAFRFILSLE